MRCDKNIEFDSPEYLMKIDERIKLQNQLFKIRLEIEEMKLRHKFERELNREELIRAQSKMQTIKMNIAFLMAYDDEYFLLKD